MAVKWKNACVLNEKTFDGTKYWVELNITELTRFEEMTVFWNSVAWRFPVNKFPHLDMFILEEL